MIKQKKNLKFLILLLICLSSCFTVTCFADMHFNASGENASNHLQIIETDLGPQLVQTGPPPKFEGGFSDSIIGILSIIVFLLIFGTVVLAGIKMGASYRYDLPAKTRRLLSIGHILSCLPVISMGIYLTYQIYLNGTPDNGLPATALAVIGVQSVLVLSSLTQVWSLKQNRPLQPLHLFHILFAIIGMILLMTVRIPLFSIPGVSILIISTQYIPGAVFSLFCGHIIKKDESAVVLGSITRNVTMTDTGHQTIRIGNTPISFPEALTNKYHDISVVGSGGMAIVYRAVRNDDTVVALKIPFSPDEDSGKTFLNEIMVWRELDHPNIVKILDQNVYPIPYVEIEYIPRTLRELTRPVPPKRAVSIIHDVASALIYAHDKKVIHRDIKPGNILVTDEGVCKVSDWGLSRSLARDDTTRNMSFSLQYATPEQLDPKIYGSGDQRIDIYQLGVLFYEMICGRLPYDTESMAEMFLNIQKNKFPLPSEFSKELEIYDEIIIHVLKADPEERFETVRQFITELDSINNSK